MDRDARIEDRAFAAPLPIHALVSAAQTDDATARALLAKKNPVLVEAVAQGQRQGKIEGKIEAVLAVLEARAVLLSDADRQTLSGERDPARLDRWLEAAVTCVSAEELFAS